MIINKDVEKSGNPPNPVSPALRTAAFDPPPDYSELDGVEDQRGRVDPPALQPSEPPRFRRLKLLIIAAIIWKATFLCLVRPMHHAALDFYLAKTRQPDSEPTTEIRWKSCGKGVSKADFLCANITVPLDYRNWGQTDNRTAVVAVTKRLATDPKNKLGSLFLNPGGPGGSGTNFAYRKGKQLDKVLQGRYDLIGFDPRGINLTKPLTKCFDSEFSSELYSAADYHDSFDLPSSLRHHHDSLYTPLHRQVSFSTAGFRAGAAQCLAESGDALAYVGTEAVVKDIEYMAWLVEGDGRINFAGFSYGTVIGQCLVAMLPKEKIGKIWIDGVVNPDTWSGTPEEIVAEGLENIDDVTRSFAESCAAAGDRCALSYLSASEILHRLDHDLIDALYDDPQPVTGLTAAPHVGVAAASDVRKFIFSNAYRIETWPEAAQILKDAFAGDFTALMNKVADIVDPADVSRKDGGDFAIYAIGCADVAPAAKDFTTTTLTDAVLRTMRRFSVRSGDGFWSLGLCAWWPIPSRSRFPGPFGLPDGALDTPILVVSNTYDPVTSLASGWKAKERLGDNARLVQQDGWGHCSLNQVSYCTIKIVREYFLEGKVPSSNHTICAVDQHAFEPFDPHLAAEQILSTSTSDTSFTESAEEVRQAMEAWRSLGEGLEVRRTPKALLA